MSPNNTGDLTQWLQADAGSGLLFNLSAHTIYLDNEAYADKVIYLPVSKHAHSTTWPPGTELVGIRFHPGVHFLFDNGLHDQPYLLNGFSPLADSQSVHQRLSQTSGHFSRIVQLYKWLDHHINLANQPPGDMQLALHRIRNLPRLNRLFDQELNISQRQLERQFKSFLGMSPKYYQQIQRVKQALGACRTYHV